MGEARAEAEIKPRRVKLKHEVYRVTVTYVGRDRKHPSIFPAELANPRRKNLYTREPDAEPRFGAKASKLWEPDTRGRQTADRAEAGPVACG